MPYASPAMIEATDRGSSRGAAQRRRGMALLLVLLLLSLTVGLSYAAMRSMSTAGMIQRNSDRRASARQAAITGLAMALKKMHRSNWSGVDTSLSGSLNSTDSFVVTYATGDPSLASNNSDIPYRVTLLSTGYSADSQQTQAVASYRVRGVVRFIPRKLAAEPASWTSMMDYTAFQWKSGDFRWEPPMRIEGRVRVQATMFPALMYAWWEFFTGGKARVQYLKDLNAMNSAAKCDWRPFTAKITLRESAQILDTMTVLNTYLGLASEDCSDSMISDMTYASAISRYQIYPGGKTYTIPQLPSSIQNVTYQSDPATNPAGLFCRAGSLVIGSSTTIKGSIFTTANSGSQLIINGQKVSLAAVSLPTIQGTTAPVQLPVAAVADDIVIAAGADVTINGLVATSGRFQVASDDQGGITLTHLGKLIAQDFDFRPRNDWNSKDYSWWSARYDAWYAQKGKAGGYQYFPEYLQKLATGALDPVPKVIIKANTDSIQYHWHNPQNTIYIAHPTDGGLRWDLLNWTENP
jgi:hypothetical protein